MTGVMAFAVPLIVLGVVCAPRYVRWPSRSRNNAAVAVAVAVDTERAAGRIDGRSPIPAPDRHGH
jgi:hypothetical protein